MNCSVCGNVNAQTWCIDHTESLDRLCYSCAEWAFNSYPKKLLQMILDKNL